MLAPAIIALVFASIILVLGLVILQELRDTDTIFGAGATENTTLYAAADSTVTGMATFPDFWEIIVLAIVTTVVIGLLVSVFGRRNR